jgi:hypothetical protein
MTVALWERHSGQEVSPRQVPTGKAKKLEAVDPGRHVFGRIRLYVFKKAPRSLAVSAGCSSGKK